MLGFTAIILKFFVWYDVFEIKNCLLDPYMKILNNLLIMLVKKLIVSEKLTSRNVLIEMVKQYTQKLRKTFGFVVVY